MLGLELYDFRSNGSDGYCVGGSRYSGGQLSGGGLTSVCLGAAL